jgi:hypothetical protein
MAVGMSKKPKKDEREKRDELDESELEEQNVPDREAMSVITPFVSSPEVTLPVEPPD